MTATNPLGKLLRFREAHPVQEIHHDGVDWEYIVAGQGAQALLVLGGAMSTPESSFETIQHYETDFRLIAPAYPPVKTMAALTDGIVRILTAEGLGQPDSFQQVHVTGQSLGAGIAHVLIRRHPQFVDKLVLSGFGLYNEQNTKRARTAMRMFRLAPYRLITGYYRKRMRALLQPAEPEAREFYLAYMDDLFDRQLNRRKLIGQFELMADMVDHAAAYRVYEPVERPGRVLILQAKDDTGFAPDEQAALRDTYPGAQVHIFESGGHLAGLTQRAEFESLRRAFLIGQ